MVRASIGERTTGTQTSLNTNRTIHAERVCPSCHLFASLQRLTNTGCPKDIHCSGADAFYSMQRLHSRKVTRGTTYKVSLLLLLELNKLSIFIRFNLHPIVTILKNSLFLPYAESLLNFVSTKFFQQELSSWPNTNKIWQRCAAFFPHPTSPPCISRQ